MCYSCHTQVRAQFSMPHKHRVNEGFMQCSDCHNPHSGKLYAAGNALCVRCHEPTRFDLGAHSHHAVGKAPLCIDCHMPRRDALIANTLFTDHYICVPTEPGLQSDQHP